MITALPAATAVTLPAPDTVATPVLLDAHSAVTAPVVLLLYVAVADTDVCAPTSSVVVPALTLNPVTVTDSACTVTVTEALCPPYVPVSTALPAATAITLPAPDTVATPVLLDVHVADVVTVPSVPSL